MDFPRILGEIREINLFSKRLQDDSLILKWQQKQKTCASIGGGSSCWEAHDSISATAWLWEREGNSRENLCCSLLVCVANLPVTLCLWVAAMRTAWQHKKWVRKRALKRPES